MNRSEIRLDKYLVDQELAPSRTKAQELIESGKVWVNGRAVYQPSWLVTMDTPPQIEIHDNSVLRYVSRAGLKLEAALHHLGLDVDQFKCLDIGLSTGGFADCLLQKGASFVVGVDVGHNQVDPRLLRKFGRQLKVIEGLNAKELEASPLFSQYREESFDLVTVDVSFISLKDIIPVTAKFLTCEGHLLALVKPQFEVGPENLNKNGVVKNPALYETVQTQTVNLFEKCGLRVIDYFESAVPGKDGNREFFCYARF